MSLSSHIPQHLAVIMDGNGRWAKKRGLPRLEGHRRGANTARAIVEWAADAGVKQISLYAFSTENWSRPKLEIMGLMRLLSNRLPKMLPEMQERGVRVLSNGAIDALPEHARQALAHIIHETRHNSRIDLILCLNYSGRYELLEGAKSAMRWVLQQEQPQQAIEQFSEADFRQHLWSEPLLPIDLLIRTGGEQRLSNFYLWDAAYAELHFSDRYWPDFSAADFKQALADYARRERRFGQTSEQISNE